MGDKVGDKVEIGSDGIMVKQGFTPMRGFAEAIVIAHGDVTCWEADCGIDL